MNTNDIRTRILGTSKGEPSYDGMMILLLCDISDKLSELLDATSHSHDCDGEIGS